MKQQAAEIINFLKRKVEPLDDSFYGPSYRAAARLIDGTFLPCVIFRNPKALVNLAIQRFEEEQTGKSIFRKLSKHGYHDIVKTFVASGNRINEYDVFEVEKSKFAFPLSIQQQIKGETTMGWTGFAAKMKDGKIFGFGTTFHSEFFQIPDGYSGDDIAEIIDHSYVLKSGLLRSHYEGYQTRPDDYANAVVYREKVFFECFINDL